MIIFIKFLKKLVNGSQITFLRHQLDLFGYIIVFFDSNINKKRKKEKKIYL